MNILIKLLKSNLYAISLYFKQIMGTLILFLIARYMSVYDFGLFSSYKNIAAFCLVFANMGYGDYILISSDANKEKVNQKLALFILNAIFLVIIFSIFSYFFKLDSHVIFCLVLFRTFFDTVFFSLIIPYFQASRKFNEISCINIVYSIFIGVISILSYILKLSLFKFLILNIILGLINYIQFSFYSKISYIIIIKNLKESFRLVDKSILGYIGVTLAFILYSQIPSLYVSTFLTKEDAALYFSAYTIASVIGLLIVAQNQKVVPEMIYADKEKVEKIIDYNFKFITGINTLIFVFFLFFGKRLLSLLYGQEYYSGGYFLLLIFTLSNISLALANIYGAYITASGNQHLKIRMQIEAIFISIVALLIFYKLGVYAGALSYFLSATYIGIRYTLKTKFLLVILEKDKI